MANYPPYGYNTPQMAQGQPMMGPQGQPGYIPQQMQQMAQQAQPMAPEPRYIVRPVASEMEAMAAPTPFDGSVLLMTDLSHGMIYAKSLNCADGTALFGRYAAQAPAPAEPVEQYAPMSAVDQLRRELEALRAELPGTKSAPGRGGKKEAAEA